MPKNTDGIFIHKSITVYSVNNPTSTHSNGDDLMSPCSENIITLWMLDHN